MSIGLNSLYMRIGKRCLPVHKLSIILGETKCANLKAYIGTGCDWISKYAFVRSFCRANSAKKLFEKAREYLKKHGSICAKI